MKKIVLLLAVVSMVACKNKEVKSQVEEENSTEAVETVATADTIDYGKYGMQSDDAPKGLAKGSKAPVVDLTIDGEKIALADLYKDQKIAIIFYRGHWCPSCNKHLSEFTARAKDLEAKGVKLIAITPELQESIQKTKEKTGADFTIVSDVDGTLLAAFDVDYKVTDAYVDKVNEKLKISIAKNNAIGEAQLPVPATYVIDTDGIIVYSHFNPDYGKRASIDDILAAL